MQFSILVSVAVFLSSTNALVIPTIEKRNYNVSSSVDNPERFEAPSMNTTFTDGMYIVVLKNQLSDNDVQNHTSWVAQKRSLAVSSNATSDFLATIKGLKLSDTKGIISEFNVDNKFKGYAGYFSPDTIKKIQLSPDVAYVEQDSSYQGPSGKSSAKNPPQRTNIEENSESNTAPDIGTKLINFQKSAKSDDVILQNAAPWNLARISRKEPLDQGKKDSYPYVYDTKGGAGVTAYIIDDGILAEHKEFEGRASLLNSDSRAVLENHGTYIAGIIGSRSYGVAKNVKLVAVHGMNYSQYTIVQYIWAVKRAIEDHKRKLGTSGFKGSTMNVSFGKIRSQALNDVVDAAVDAGIHVATTAGNLDRDACDFSPGSSEKVITVGATDSSDNLAGSSNYGKCVDIFAPGVDILSTWAGEQDISSLRYWLGIPATSATLNWAPAAAPHVTGLLSYFLSLAPENGSGFSSAKAVTPKQLKKALIAFGTKDIIKKIPAGSQTPNILAYNGAGGDLSKFWASM